MRRNNEPHKITIKQLCNNNIKESKKMSKNNQNYGTLQVGSTTYPLQKTTFSSIIAISEEIDRIPVVMAKSNDDIVSSTFRNALLYREASSVIAVGLS